MSDEAQLTGVRIIGGCCGTCVSVCRSKSIDLDGFTDDQVFAALAALAD